MVSLSHFSPTARLQHYAFFRCSFPAFSRFLRPWWWCCCVRSHLRPATLEGLLEWEGPQRQWACWLKRQSREAGSPLRPASSPALTLQPVKCCRLNLFPYNWDLKEALLYLIINSRLTHPPKCHTAGKSWHIWVFFVFKWSLTCMITGFSHSPKNQHIFRNTNYHHSQ